MTLLDHSTERRLGWGLILAIGLTRIPALAGMSLPDASLAAFFIGGLYLTGLRPFGGLLAAAFVADWVAFDAGTVAPTCLTPAYLFLVPTYGIVWAAGRWSRRSRLTEYRWAARATLHLVAAVVAAFVLSNAAYYAFATDAAALGGLDYAAAVSRYFPAYAGAALGYAIPALLVAQWRAYARRTATA